MQLTSVPNTRIWLFRCTANYLYVAWITGNDCSPQFSVNFVAIVRKWEKISSWVQAYVLCGKCFHFLVLSSAHLFSAMISHASCYTTYLNNLHLITVHLDIFFSSLTPVHAPSVWLLQTSPQSLVPEFILLLYSRCQGIKSLCTIIHHSDNVYSNRINAEKIPWPLQCTVKHQQYSPIPQWMYLNS